MISDLPCGKRIESASSARDVCGDGGHQGGDHQGCLWSSANSGASMIDGTFEPEFQTTPSDRNLGWDRSNQSDCWAFSSDCRLGPQTEVLAAVWTPRCERCDELPAGGPVRPPRSIEQVCGGCLQFCHHVDQQPFKRPSTTSLGTK